MSSAALHLVWGTFILPCFSVGFAGLPSLLKEGAPAIEPCKWLLVALGCRGRSLVVSDLLSGVFFFVWLPCVGGDGVRAWYSTQFIFGVADGR